jgi:hypothetical protein
MNALVIGDIHNNISPLDSFLKKWKGRVIFVGDYFDDFGDDPYYAMFTADWLKQNLDNPNYTFLIGNHDFHYMTLPYLFYCSGYNEHKHEAIDKILTPDDWKKMKFFHAEENYWFSHAGVTSKWFGHPVRGLDSDTVQNIVEKCLPFIRTGPFDSIAPLWAADRARGGYHSKGGLLWNDWRNREFIPNVTQIVGHTPQEDIVFDRRDDINSACINVDAYKGHRKALLINNNKYETLYIE